MKRQTILLALYLVLLCAGLAFAGDETRFLGKLKAAIPVATAVFGFAGGVLALVPKINAIRDAIEKAKKESIRVNSKYQGLVQYEIHSDLDRVLKSYDGVLERIADLLGMIRMKKAERTLRNLL